MKRCICLSFLMLMLFCLGLTSVQANSDECHGEWELVKNKNGIKAYSRKVEGSGIFQFRAVAVFDAPVEVVSEALRDVPANTEWIPDCDEAYMVKQEDRNHFTNYMSLDLSWPVSDRDLVLKTETKYDYKHGRAITNFWDTELPGCPPREDHIRIPEVKGQYVFEYVTREKTGIVHTYRADLGGHIPEWMANFATKNHIYNEFMNLKEMFQKEKYLERAKTSPDRKLCENILENKERVKKIMVARLREFIKDSDFVDMVKDSRKIDPVLTAQNGKISETLLYGWGSEKSKKKAVRVVLKAYMTASTNDQALIDEVLNDEHLINNILHGPGPSEKNSRQIIEAYLEKGSARAAQINWKNIRAGR